MADKRSAEVVSGITSFSVPEQGRSKGRLRQFRPNSVGLM